MIGSDYANNKLFFQMWIADLQDRLLKHREYMHITINGINPGFVNTGIWNSVKSDGFLKSMRHYFAITPQQGSLAITHAATSSEFGPDCNKQGVGAPVGRGGGKYINRIWEAPARSCCNDPEARLRLWNKLDEELHLQEKGLLEILGS
jgi:NAD(P)-dependent dehydrogenase (short-subunit alcohol dehydrogenase family)